MADGDMMDDCVKPFTEQWANREFRRQLDIMKRWEEKLAHASRCHYCGEPIDGEWVSFRCMADGELAYAHESACPK